MTYSQLQTAIADYLHRTDLTSVIPGLITRAEAYLFRELLIKEMQITVTGTTTSGGYGALPADFGSVSKVTVSSGSTWTLNYQSVPEVSSSVDAYPKYYSLENNSLRIFNTGAGTNYSLTYIPEIAPLSNSNTSNWLLVNAEDLYTYASCLEGARYIRDNAEVDRLTGLVSAGLDSVKRYSERRGQPSIGALQIKPRRG